MRQKMKKVSGLKLAREIAEHETESAQSVLKRKAAQIYTRFAKAARLKRAGANIYRVLIVKLADEKTKKLGEDPVIYAIRTIKEPKEAKSFFFGYAKDIRRHPKQHPKQAQKNPREYARAAIMLALNLYFIAAETHKLWTKAVNGKKAKFAYVRPPNW